MIKKKNISREDLDTWKSYIKNPTDVIDKELDSKKNVSKPYRYRFDLHGFTLDDANKKIYELINASYSQGVNKLIIVTGKGLHSENEKDPFISKDLGILKYSVPDYINSKKELMILINEIKEANKEDGGAGAFYIFLKKKTIK